jgi:SAM-dependent methyltransferase
MAAASEKVRLFFHKYFPDCSSLGVDISPESIRKAEEENIAFTISTISDFLRPGEFPNWGKFDVIYIANVFHHIPHELHHDILVHLRTQLKPGGHLFMFEHNPWNPVTVRTINQCEFDKDAVLLTPDYAVKTYKKAGFIKVKQNFTLFFPAIASGLIPLEKYLRWLPLGAQYYIHAQ